MDVHGEETKTAPGAAVQRGVGAVLRDRRIELNLELPDVADSLRIRRAYLSAIESGRLDDLPGHIYAVGFIRTYATFLGFDGEQVLERFKQEASLAPQPVRLNFPPPPPESRAPRSWMIILGLVAAGALYAAWEFHQRFELPIADTAPPPVARTPAPAATPATEPVQSTAAAPSSADTPTVQGAPPGSPPGAATATAPMPGIIPPPPMAAAPATTAATQTPAPPAVAPPASAPPATPAPAAAPPPRAVDVATLPAAGAVAPAATPPAPSTTPPPVATDGTRVVLQATADSWVTVTGANGEVLVPGRVMRPGDTLKLPDRKDAQLWTGNLGGLDVLVDGKVLPKLGQSGEAKRNVSLDPAKLTAGTAVPR